MVNIDPITLTVVRNNLISTAISMQEIAFRCGVTTLMYEEVDCAFALLDSNTGLIAQSHGVLIFVGTLGPAANNFINFIGKENIEPRDIIISTVPSITGTHQADAVLMMPIFYNNKIFSYAVSKAHWSDIGAKVAFPTDSRSVYEEGLLMPPTKIYKEGKLQPEIWQIINWNSRAPDAVWGDMQAQIAACLFAEKRVTELLDKYGEETVTKCIEEMYNYSEYMTRLGIREISDGTWTAEDYLDDNGIDIGKPVITKATITVKDSNITVDLTGSSVEQKGPVNSRFIGTQSGVWGAIKALTTPKLPINQGCFRPVSIVVPENCVYNASIAAPSFLCAWTSQSILELVNKALYSTLPTKIPACSAADICCTAFSGINPKNGKYWVCLVLAGIGQGADFSSDGENYLCHHAASANRNPPAEVLEIKFPLFVERVEFIKDSGGAGKYRGGLASKLCLRLLKPATFLSTIDKGTSPHWGIFGGKAGMRNYALIQSKQKGEFEMLKGMVEMDAGDRVTIVSGGGGGYGNPLERDIEAVHEDVINGYVSLELAKQDYGVVINPRTLSVDIEATKNLR